MQRAGSNGEEGPQKQVEAGPRLGAGFLFGGCQARLSALSISKAALPPRELRTFSPGVNQAMRCCTVTQLVPWALKVVSNLSQFRKL